MFQKRVEKVYREIYTIEYCQNRNRIRELGQGKIEMEVECQDQVKEEHVKRAGVLRAFQCFALLCDKSGAPTVVCGASVTNSVLPYTKCRLSLLHLVTSDILLYYSCVSDLSSFIPLK